MSEAKPSIRIQPPAGSEQTPPALLAFVGFETRLRKAADLRALQIVLSNDVREVISSRQALVLLREGRAWRIVSVTAMPDVNPDAPLMRALANLAARKFVTGQTQILNLHEDAAVLEYANAAVVFRHGLLSPLRRRDGDVFAAILYLRERPWREQDIALSEAIAESAAHAWLALAPQASSRPSFLRRRAVALSILAGLAVLACIPVPVTALAPAEVVPANPFVVAAPIDGVVESLPVAPNTHVAKGDVILRFADTKLRNDAELAKRNFAVAQARLHRIVQSTFGSPKDGHDLAIARAELELAGAEYRRASELLDRATLRAPQAGLLIYSSREDWIGKPLTTGERVMDIVDPRHIELRIDLALSDVVALQKDSEIQLFPDGDPLDKRQASLTRPGYRPLPVAGGNLAYRSYASFPKSMGDGLRIGVRGTAKIYAGKAPLGFFLLRRPLATLRQHVGL